MVYLEDRRRVYSEGVDDPRQRRNERNYLVLHRHSEQSQEVGIGSRRKDKLLRRLSSTVKEGQQDDFRIVATRDFTAGIGTITDKSCPYSLNACRLATIGYSFSTIVCEMERRGTMSLSVASAITFGMETPPVTEGVVTRAVTDTIEGLGRENSPSVTESMLG